MGRIKSAWEIALERTEAIEVDADKIRHSANIDAIRRVAGAFLLADEDTEASTREKLSSYCQADLKEALGQTILNTLVLSPVEKTEDKTPQRALTLLDIALPGDQNTASYLLQVQQHLAQYPIHLKQLLEQLKQQYEPMLKQKAQQLKEQYGQEVPVSFEQDKECQQLAEQYSDKLYAQYQQVLDEAKTNLKAIFGC